MNRLLTSGPLRTRRRRVTAAVLAVAVVAGAGVLAVAGGDDAKPLRTDEYRIAGVREADGVPVNLDATVYWPDVVGPAPAVLVAHGYGGTKASVAAQAQTLARHGYVAMTWSARGFGDSGGKIHLDSPSFEVKDAQRLVDWLAARPEVRRDGPGDPRIGVVGASYGGALSLLLAGVDRRIDAIAPSITWNDLGQALFPQFATASTALTPAGLVPRGGVGVFKKAWTGSLLASGLGAGASAAGTSAAPGAGGSADLGAQVAAACGRLDVQICTGYAEAATTGRPGARLLELLAASSPARVLRSITAPTLIMQGQTDSLFPLSEGDANARGIAANGTPVAVDWIAAGHDGGLDETARLTTLVQTWFDHYLQPATPSRDLPVPGFSVTVPDAVVSSVDGNPAPQLRETSGGATEPGLPGGAPLTATRVPLTGGPQIAVSPPGAYPAALSTLPGIGSLLAQVSTAAGAAGSSAAGSSAAGAAAFGSSVLPGQSAVFLSGELTSELHIVGSSHVTVSVTSSAGDATLFASLVDRAPDGTLTLPARLVSPVRLTGPANQARTVSLTLPAIVADVPAGHRLGVVVSSTDQAYALPADTRVYTVALAGGAALTVPGVAVAAVADDTGGRLALTAVAMLLVTLLGVLLAVLLSRRRRRADDTVDPGLGLDDVPLAIAGLSKSYAGGFRAVTDLSFRVEAGQVLGLLGPNGAGKTTTLRMLMGLILPTEGEIRVFGRRVRPGAPVLSRIGAFVEGPGFLPHLSGLANLELYWAATGRPASEAHLAEALEVAGLRDDVARTVRTYSQGMRQRLAIAQAMLGLPDLLVLDEPTNGLDPPQIREMREVLRGYAATGRTVVVSSHLLAEVEQTCTDVVVMHHGRLVAQGPVADIVGASGAVALDVDDPAKAALVAVKVRGVDDVRTTDTGLVVHSPDGARADLVAALVRSGVRVERVAPHRGLEEAFLDLVGQE